MPATGSSTSSSRGLCISSMPISSHCFWPWDSAPAGVSAAAESPICCSTSRMRSRCAAESLATRVCPHGAVARQRQFQILECAVPFEHGGLLEFAADARLRNLGLGQFQQIQRLAEPCRAMVGARLAGDDIHHGGLAGAVRADDATQLTGLHIERQRIECLESVKRNRQVFQIQDVAMGPVRTARYGITMNHGALARRRGTARPSGQSLPDLLGVHAARSFALRARSRPARRLAAAA